MSDIIHMGGATQFRFGYHRVCIFWMLGLWICYVYAIPRFKPRRFSQLELGPMANASVRKRGSPGVEGTSRAEVALTDAQVEKLEASQKALETVELFLELHALKHLQPYYTKRRELLKGIPKFWPVALGNHPMVGLMTAHAGDQDALGYVEEVWIERDPKEPRAYKIEFVSTWVDVGQASMTFLSSTLRKTRTFLTKYS